MTQQTTSNLLSLRNLSIRTSSRVSLDEAEFGLTQPQGNNNNLPAELAILAPRGSIVFQDFDGVANELDGHILLVGPANARNLKGLRALLPWLRPQLVGLQTSAGFGDRLGLATPGHIRALRSVGAVGKIAPIFAQQSIREMTRTSRTPQQVMDSATWAVFAEGWRSGFGADADHLKLPTDIDACLSAGFTFFTIDPGAFVENAAASLGQSELDRAYEQLPWKQLDDSPKGLAARYVNRTFMVEGKAIAFDDHNLKMAAVKYGRAVAHVTAMFRHLEKTAGKRPYELEISVDETESPTTHDEHIYVAGELKRLGVRWVSLAPRFVGSFEKGVDYQGDLAAFEADIAVHAAIARQFGPYKISLHSGSDKFSIYPAATRQTRGNVHLKTAGTSYLEALRVVASADTLLFRSIYRLARDRYETDRASYHVSGMLANAPKPETLVNSALPALLDQFDVRQLLHVTFGSVLKDQELCSGLMAVLQSHPEQYADVLVRHFRKHLAPFVERK